MVLLAPYTREQWYLLASPFLSEVDGIESPPPAGGVGNYMLGREMAGNFDQRPPWDLRFFNVQ
jgi:hypothetical protein